MTQIFLIINLEFNTFLLMRERNARRFIRCTIFYVFFIFFTLELKAQQKAELQQVTPLSPEAAAFTKYGEVPVSHFTGIPEIGIPLYTIKSKALSLNLAFSYHAGGNKVEDLPSWVGMGWSLSSIPSVSRSVRGMLDESTPGVRDLVNGKSMDDIIPILLGNEHPEEYNIYSCPAIDGTIDTEADIYYYSLPGKSGRFYWNYKKKRYQTDPYSNIRIVGLPYSGGFEITDDDGTVYRITEGETSQTSSSVPGPITTNSWYASRVYDANRTDSLVFNSAMGFCCGRKRE